MSMRVLAWRYALQGEDIMFGALVAFIPRRLVGPPPAILAALVWLLLAAPVHAQYSRQIFDCSDPTPLTLFGEDDPQMSQMTPGFHARTPELDRYPNDFHPRKSAQSADAFSIFPITT